MNKLLLILFFFSTQALAKEFDEPKCLKANIDFWEKVYTKYGEDDMIIHDDVTFEIYKVGKVPPLAKKKQRKKAVQALLEKVRRSLPKEWRDRVRAQSGIKQKFDKGFELAKTHIPPIQKALIAENMPPQLALIPLIESSFQFNARSKVGAYGAWQIMPATLRAYSKTHRKKLGNLDFSTKIAIMILQDSYDALESWPLAINAYHSGIGRLKKATEQLGTKDICKIVFEYEERAYKFASRNYYSQFLAAKRVWDRRNKKQDKGSR